MERVIDSLRYEVRRYDGSYLDEEYAFEDWMPMVMEKREIILKDIQLSLILQF